MDITPSDLKKVELFESLLPDQLKQVAAIVDEHALAPSSFVFREGDTADRFYFVVSGKVRISKQIPGMGEEALAILEPGHSFGEMALIDESTRSADAITNTSCVLGSIPKNNFDQLLFTNRDLAHDLLWSFVRSLSSRLRESNEKMRAFLAMSRF
jgi:CRP/FNR family transcriptional regulator, cyclic AMP receptor protein